MKVHIKKILMKYYEELLKGNKTFELRKDDSNYEVGDLIKFLIPSGKDRIYYNDPNLITSKVNINKEHGWVSPYKDSLWEITYILRNTPEYGLKEGYCILALKRVQITDYVETWTPGKVLLNESNVTSPFEAVNK